MIRTSRRHRNRSRSLKPDRIRGDDRLRLRSDALSKWRDARVAALAAEPDAYNEYVLVIRQEYSEFSDEAFRAGRLRFLETIPDAPYLLQTDFRLDRFQASAHKNLQNEVAQLQSDHA